MGAALVVHPNSVRQVSALSLTVLQLTISFLKLHPAANRIRSFLRFSG